jgi:hypothetical protein
MRDGNRRSVHGRRGESKSVLVLLSSLVLLPVLLPVPAHAAKPGWIVTCQHSHTSRDDPIVFPGVDGAGHLHEFAAASTTDENSTTASLRAGGSTCAIHGDTSAYWVPALYEDAELVHPNATGNDSLFYYRRIGAGSGTEVRPFPDELRIIIGNGHAMSPEENPQLGTDIIFKCGPGSTVDRASPPERCESGVLVISVRFPNCWDGFRLDSTDHRSHMAYPVRGTCPPSHPVNLPRMESFFRYPVGTDPIDITLASGPYYTMHQDFFAAWDPSILQSLLDRCINAMLDCGKNPLP